ICGLPFTQKRCSRPPTTTTTAQPSRHALSTDWTWSVSGSMPTAGRSTRSSPGCGFSPESWTGTGIQECAASAADRRRGLAEQESLFLFGSDTGVGIDLRTLLVGAHG